MATVGKKPFDVSLIQMLKARFPLLYIATWEEGRVVAEIATIGKGMRTPRKIYTWSLTNGLQAEGAAADNSTTAPLKALEKVTTINEPAIFIFKDFHIYFANDGKKNPEIIRKLRDLTGILEAGRFARTIIFTAPTFELPVDLQKEISVIDFDLPDFEFILNDILKPMIEANRNNGKIVIDLADDDTERLAQAALGLTVQEAKNAFALAMVNDGRLDINDVESVLNEKRQIIKKSNILEYIKSDFDLNDVGGMENLKRWLGKRNKSWSKAAERYCLPAPKGVLLTGVPGCGKSLAAKAISAAWNLPLLRMDVGRIFGGLVGQSEENMRMAIKTAEAIAPTILWIDEIEKGFGGMGGSSDGGTSTRVFGTFLTWMQEKTAQVFVIATANNISNLPPEMLRKGRFDEIFFVDLPTQRERQMILELHMRKRLRDPQVLGDFEINEDNLANIARITEGFVGAELESVVIGGLFEAFAETRSVTLADFQKVVRNTVPLSITQAEQIRELRSWANVRAVSASSGEDLSGYANVEKDTENVAAENSISDFRGGRMLDF